MPFRITCVCLGNICRSPVAEAVLRQRIALAGLADEVVVDSAGTGGWHVGHDMDPRSRAVLDVHGYPHAHTARQFTAAWLGTGAADLLLAMDAANYDDMLSMIEKAADGLVDGLPRMLQER